MREQKEKDFSYQGSTDIWVADFGTHGLSEDLDKELNKIKLKKPKKISWIFLASILFIVLVILEYYINKFVSNLGWSTMMILWTTWLWRFCMIIIWLFIARVKFLLDYKKIIAVSFISFVSTAIFSAIVKIVFVKTLWAWLNFLVEPIWMAILVAFSLGLFIKIKK